MEFGPISLFGAIIVVLMLIPNIVYAIRHRGERNICDNEFMNVIEAIGRYACIILMWLPLFNFGFPNVLAFIIYAAGNGIMLIAYWVLFAIYMKKRTRGLALALAILPTCIFLLSGLTLRNWLLVFFAVLFGVGHIYVTLENAEEEESAEE